MTMDMSVEAAEAQLRLVQTREEFLQAKTAYLEDKTDEAAKAAYRDAADSYVEVRDEWKLNHRVAPDGPGDATVGPAPLEASTKKG